MWRRKVGWCGHMKVKMPSRYPSGDGQLVVGSLILELQDRVWGRDIKSYCISVPLLFFLPFDFFFVVVVVSFLKAICLFDCTGS